MGYKGDMEDGNGGKIDKKGGGDKMGGKGMLGGVYMRLGGYGYNDSNGKSLGKRELEKVLDDCDGGGYWGG